MLTIFWHNLINFFDFVSWSTYIATVPVCYSTNSWLHSDSGRQACSLTTFYLSDGCDITIGCLWLVDDRDDNGCSLAHMYTWRRIGQFDVNKSMMSVQLGWLLNSMRIFTTLRWRATRHWPAHLGPGHNKWSPYRRSVVNTSLCTVHWPIIRWCSTSDSTFVRRVQCMMPDLIYLQLQPTLPPPCPSLLPQAKWLVWML